MGKSMSFENLKKIVEEYADECVMKFKEECAELSDGLIIAYLIPIIPKQDLNAFYWYQNQLIREYRKRVKEHLEWLNE